MYIFQLTCFYSYLFLLVLPTFYVKVGLFLPARQLNPINVALITGLLSSITQFDFHLEEDENKFESFIPSLSV